MSNKIEKPIIAIVLPCFNEEEIFSFRRITLSPIVILAGFVIVLLGIMKKSKD